MLSAYPSFRIFRNVYPFRFDSGQRRQSGEAQHGSVNQRTRRRTMLGLTRDDFTIKAENFDLTKGGNILRIAAGAFMFPHVAGKFAVISTLTLKAGIAGF